MFTKFRIHASYRTDSHFSILQETNSLSMNLPSNSVKEVNQTSYMAAELFFDLSNSNTVVVTI